MEKLAGDMEAPEVKEKDNFYSNKHRAFFYCYNRIKLWKAPLSGRKAEISSRIAQA